MLLYHIEDGKSILCIIVFHNLFDKKTSNFSKKRAKIRKNAFFCYLSDVKSALQNDKFVMQKISEIVSAPCGAKTPAEIRNGNALRFLHIAASRQCACHHQRWADSFGSGRPKTAPRGCVGLFSKETKIWDACLASRQVFETQTQRVCYQVCFANLPCPAYRQADSFGSGRPKCRGATVWLPPCILAYPTGFEPAASRVGVLRSIQLGYG